MWYKDHTEYIIVINWFFVIVKYILGNWIYSAMLGRGVLSCKVLQPIDEMWLQKPSPIAQFSLWEPIWIESLLPNQSLRELCLGPMLISPTLTIYAFWCYVQGRQFI